MAPVSDDGVVMEKRDRQIISKLFTKALDMALMSGLALGYTSDQLADGFIYWLRSNAESMRRLAEDEPNE